MIDMTNILLTLIAVLLLARIALQACPGRAFKRAILCAKSLDELVCQLCDGLEYWDYELVSILKDDDGLWIAILQRKKFKNYMEK